MRACVRSAGELLHCSETAGKAHPLLQQLLTIPTAVSARHYRRGSCRGTCTLCVATPSPARFGRPCKAGGRGPEGREWRSPWQGAMLVVPDGVFLAEISECLAKPAKCCYCLLALGERWMQGLSPHGALCQQRVAANSSLYSSSGFWPSAPRTILELKIISWLLGTVRSGFQPKTQR